MSDNNPVSDNGEVISQPENLVVNDNENESMGDMVIPSTENHPKQSLVKFDYQTRQICNSRCKFCIFLYCFYIKMVC